MPEATLAGHRTHWRCWGEGGRPLLALHCSLAHSGVWAGVAQQLAGVSLTAPDLPGHGRSADWDGSADFHGLTTRIAEALALALGGGGPVDLLGHSFGATVALRLALERPDLLRSLTLVEPVLFAAARAGGGREFAVHEAALLPFQRAMAAGDRELAAELFQALWGGDVPFNSLAEPQRRYIADRIHLIAAADPVLTHDRPGLLAPGRLESLSLPVLMIEGAKSPAVVASIQRELLGRLPNARHVVVAGAGHMAPITHSAPVAAAIAGHLAAR